MDSVRADGNAVRSAVLSLRSVRPKPWMANLYAAEDLLVAGGADLLVAEPILSVPARVGRVGGPVGRLAARARIAPYRVDVSSQYDHLVVMVNDPGDLRVIHRLERSVSSFARRRTLVQTECWPMDVVRSERLVRETYAQFDDVFVTIEASVEPLRRLHPRVHPLLQWADVAAHPGAQRFGRPIDVFNYGRRDDAQHRLLCEWADDDAHRWYHYDTYVEAITPDPIAHRRSMARMLANTRVAVCNYAAFTLTERLAGAKEAGIRFFEALAGGCVVMGELPTSELYKQAFAGVEGFIDWPLDADQLPPAFLEITADDECWQCVSWALRRFAVERHDLAHRLEEIHRTIGLPVPRVVTERISELARTG
jgi:hypothetical protein